MVDRKHQTRASEVTSYAQEMHRGGALTAQRLCGLAGDDPDLLRDLARDWASKAKIMPEFGDMAKVAGQALALAIDKAY